MLFAQSLILQTGIAWLDTFLDAFWGGVQSGLVWLISLTLIDLVLGSYLAFRQGRFDLSKLPGFVDSDIVPILIWLATEIFPFLPQEVIPSDASYLTGLSKVVFTAVFVKISASVLSHLSAFGVFSDIVKVVGVKPTGSDTPKG